MTANKRSALSLRCDDDWKLGSAKRNVNHGQLNISRRPNGLSANFLQDQWINISEENNRNTDSEGKTSETYHR